MTTVAAPPPGAPPASDAALLLEHGRAVQRFCLTELRSEAEAEEAAQETFVQFLQRPPGELRNVEAWLITVARRTCWRMRTRAAGRGDEELDDSLASRDAPFDDAVLTSALVRALFQCLDERDVKVLTRLYIDGWSHEQLACELNTSAVHVRVMAQRARDRARKRLLEMGVGTAAGVVTWLALPTRAWRAHVVRVWGSVTDRANGLASRLSSGLALPATVADSLACVVALGAIATASLPAPPIDAHRAVPSTAGAAGPGGPGLPAPAGGVASGSLRGDGGADGSRSAAVTPSPGPATAWLGQTAARDQHPSTGDVGFTSFAASPAYGHDRTVFAAGDVATACPGLCPVLFVSHDGAASWQQVLPASGFAGGSVLLPPAYPADPIIFAIGPTGLQRSDDGGATFRTVVPGVTQAAMQPGAAAGQASIMLASVPLLVYSEATGLVSPGPALPAGVGAVDAITYLGDGQHVVIAGERADPLARGQTDAVLAVCDALQCSVNAAFPGVRPSAVVASSSEGSGGTVVALVGGALAVSRDDGASFTMARIGDGAAAYALAMSSRYATFPELLVIANMDTVGVSSQLLQTFDGGAAFTALAVSGLPAAAVFNAAAILPDGALLIGPFTHSGDGALGIRCSADGGRTWAAACP
ncbi:MAG: RNA polymerase sigma factor [Candidatus Dormibacteria bacterium]